MTTKGQIRIGPIEVPAGEAVTYPTGMKVKNHDWGFIRQCRNLDPHKRPDVDIVMTEDRTTGELVIEIEEQKGQTGADVFVTIPTGPLSGELNPIRGFE